MRVTVLQGQKRWTHNNPFKIDIINWTWRLTDSYKIWLEQHLGYKHFTYNFYLNLTPLCDVWKFKSFFAIKYEYLSQTWTESRLVSQWSFWLSLPKIYHSNGVAIYIGWIMKLFSFLAVVKAISLHGLTGRGQFVRPCLLWLYMSRHTRESDTRGNIFYKLILRAQVDSY